MKRVGRLKPTCWEPRWETRLPLQQRAAARRHAVGIGLFDFLFQS